MTEIQVDIQGVLELRNKLKRLDLDVRGNVDDVLRLEVESIRIQAQSLTSKRTGYLASTVFAERVSEWSFRLGGRAPYSFFVEFGTRFMQARLKMQQRGVDT